MSVAPLLVTERLELWQPLGDDVPQMMAIVAHPETARYLGPPPSKADSFARFQRNAGSWLLYGYGGFMVRLKGEAQVIGNCGIFHSWRGLGEDFDNLPEAGWIIAHDHVGQGLAQEAMSAAYRWFDETHGPCRSVCMIDPANAPSIRLAGKLGFTPLRETLLAEEPIALFERVSAKKNHL
ncbi:MAG: GNAT family N-acetyltransferase [Sphingomonadaceae bacterium]